jgi:hypothetical protein
MCTNPTKMAQPTSSLLQRSNVSQESPYSNLAAHAKTGKNWSLSDAELRALALQQLLFKLLNNSRLRRERKLLQKGFLRFSVGLLKRRRRQAVKKVKNKLTFSFFSDALCHAADWVRFFGNPTGFTFYRGPDGQMRSSRKALRTVKPAAYAFVGKYAKAVNRRFRFIKFRRYHGQGSRQPRRAISFFMRRRRYFLRARRVFLQPRVLYPLAVKRVMRQALILQHRDFVERCLRPPLARRPSLPAARD